MIQVFPTRQTTGIIVQAREQRTARRARNTLCTLVWLLTWRCDTVDAFELSQRIRPSRLYRDLRGTGSIQESSRPWSKYDDDDDDDFDLLRPSTQTTRITRSPNGKDYPSSDSLPEKSHFYSQKSLQDASFRLQGANNTFDQLCRQAGIQRPSKIQSMAWPVLVKDPSQSSFQTPNAVILADQTGSGKTLAYLIPLLQRVMGQTTPPSGSLASSTTAATPRLLILAPTAELADQIQAVCQTLAKTTADTSVSNAKLLFSTVVLTASGQHATNIRDQIRLLQQKKTVDVLISTPGRIATILRTKHAPERVLDLRQVQMVVLDEVDVLLLDETFGPQLQTIGEATNPDIADSAAPATQFVFVTATLPDTVVAQVEAQFPSRTILIKGPGLHRVAPTVRERLIDVSVPSALNRDETACFDAKARALQQALRQNRCKRTLVFCNTVSTCRQVENLLNRQDRQGQIYTVRAYHNAMTAESRNENLEFFAKAGSSTGRTMASASRDDATSYILVCTDRAARGVDFAAAAVDHVVIFDFPVDPAEYVRRVGRTARAGRDGASTVLAYGWQLPIARSVMGQQQLKDTTGKMNAARDTDGSDDEEYLGGVKGRRATTKRPKGKNANSKDSIIGGNIASGKLWNDK